MDEKQLRRTGKNDHGSRSFRREQLMGRRGRRPLKTDGEWRGGR